MKGTPTNNHTFHNVGELRNALVGIPDDTPILCQMVSEDGFAWNMFGSFYAPIEPLSVACVTLTHPQLKRMPTMD